MPKTLTRTEIIASFQNKNGYSARKSSEILETLLDLITQTLESGEDVMISGFGKFQVRNKRERKGRNPATMEDMILPARKVVTFKCSGNLRAIINR